MSFNYANALSEYPHKGILGTPEKFDTSSAIAEKCKKLVLMIQQAEHVVVHTGAGISTSIGIPDFRGPNGVWTLEKEGKSPTTNISFDSAPPSRTHMALKALVEKGFVHYIITQNIDGLHLKSGLNRKYLSELHGNVFIEQCNKCRKQFIRNTSTPTIGQKKSGGICKNDGKSKPCRGGLLYDNVLDWEHELPEQDLELAVLHSSIADLNITLGTSLQIKPSSELPLKNKKLNGKFVVCNLQPTKHDKKADLIISTYVDDILAIVCDQLGVEIKEYSEAEDPTKITSNSSWTINKEEIIKMQKKYKNKQQTMKPTMNSAQKRKIITTAENKKIKHES